MACLGCRSVVAALLLTPVDSANDTIAEWSQDPATTDHCRQTLCAPRLENFHDCALLPLRVLLYCS